MSTFWNQKTNALEPYVAGEQPKDGQKVIKLNTNENPYPPSPKCEEILKNFDISELRLYPNTDAQIVKEAVAKKNGVKPQNVFVGNGSDEVLAICWQTFFESENNTDLKVLAPSVSYSFYPVYSQNYSVKINQIPLKKDFTIDVEPFTTTPNCGIAIANPNAPTSIYLPLSEIEKILKANPESVVIIDEAYAAFKEDYESAVSLIGKYKNLVVVQTTSKAYGLAGLRVGWAIADEELIEGLLRNRDSFNSYPVDRLAQKLAAAAVNDDAYYEMNRIKLIRTRERFTEEIKALGFEVCDSSANFVFAKPSKTTAAELYAKLKEMGILVRYFNKPIISEYLRITIGTDEEMDALVKAIKEVI